MVGVGPIERGTALARTPAARQLIRFVVVGVANTLVTMATIVLLRDHAGTSVALASAVGYGVGMVQGFLLNRFWTFAGVRQTVPVAVQIAGFIVVNLICGAIFTRANVALSAYLPLAVATVASAAIIMPISFALNRWGVFRGRAA